MNEILRRIRSLGWMVGAHNDYRINGKYMTYWMFTHSEGIYVKGEAETDESALTECLEKVLGLRLSHER